MPTTVRSHAKINLGLYVGAPRQDGFHPLVTVYQTLALYDRITVSARVAGETEIRLSSNDERVPLDERNTAWKMVAYALEALGIKAEVEVHIEKRLPVQGGMGAGSANAVAALVGVERELGIWASSGVSAGIVSAEDRRAWVSRRMEVAARVGSDVPLFLIGGTALGVDRGQIVYPLPEVEPSWCVVATPSVGVSTPQAYRDWDALITREGLTAEQSAAKLNELSHAYASAFAGAIPEGWGQVGSSGVPAGSATDRSGDRAGSLDSVLVRTGILDWVENDFEKVVFAQHPFLGELKEILAASDTAEASLCAMLSGSGSALFGLYRSRSDAEAAQQRLHAAGVESLLTRTLPRTEYWGQMLQY